jgi:hypothetical protein
MNPSVLETETAERFMSTYIDALTWAKRVSEI